MRVIGLCLVLCLVVAGCASEGETTVQGEVPSESADSVEPETETRPLDAMKTRLEQAGFRVDRVEAGLPGGDSLKLGGRVAVNISFYRTPQNAAFDYERVNEVHSEFPGRGLSALEGGRRLYHFAQPRKLRPDEIAEFERIVDVAEGRRSR